MAVGGDYFGWVDIIYGWVGIGGVGESIFWGDGDEWVFVMGGWG